MFKRCNCKEEVEEAKKYADVVNSVTKKRIDNAFYDLETWKKEFEESVFKRVDKIGKEQEEYQTESRANYKEYKDEQKRRITVMLRKLLEAKDCAVRAKIFK